VDPLRLRAYGLSPLQVAGVIGQANVVLPSGDFPRGNRDFWWKRADLSGMPKNWAAW